MNLKRYQKKVHISIIGKIKKKYPFNKVLQAADHVGKGKSVIKKHIKLLKHKDPIVRYWASVGIHVQAEKAKSNKEEILKSLNDTYPCVQVEIAAWAWKMFKDEKAKDVLLKHLSGDSGYGIVASFTQFIIYGRRCQSVCGRCKRASKI